MGERRKDAGVAEPRADVGRQAVFALASLIGVGQVDRLAKDIFAEVTAACHLRCAKRSEKIHIGFG